MHPTGGTTTTTGAAGFCGLGLWGFFKREERLYLRGAQERLPGVSLGVSSSHMGLEHQIY